MSTACTGKKDYLEVFYRCQYSRSHFSFRVIFTKGHSLQWHVVGFLKYPLSSLPLMDPLRVKRSGNVACFFFFRQHHTANVRMLCLDIEDLFYSMPHDVLLIETRECIDRQGLVNFYNSAVVSVDGFLELRVFYLKSMYLLFEGKVLPRRAVCVLAREWPRL